jgi:hypothetical protein
LEKKIMPNPWEMNWGSTPAQTQPAAPWSGMPAKEANDMRQQVYKESQKRIDALRDITAKGENVLSDLERFGQLNRDTSTGGGWETLAPQWGFLHGNDINEMNSIQSRLGPAQRIQGSGSSSDRDVSLFMRGLPNTSNPGNVNKAIREDYQRQYNNAQLKQTFLENYLGQYGHLQGADEAWTKQKGKLGFDFGAAKSKGQKQGDILQNQSNQSVQDAADAIVKGK